MGDKTMGDRRNVPQELKQSVSQWVVLRVYVSSVTAPVRVYVSSVTAPVSPLLCHRSLDWLLASVPQFFVYFILSFVSNRGLDKVEVEKRFEYVKIPLCFSLFHVDDLAG